MKLFKPAIALLLLVVSCFFVEGSPVTSDISNDMEVFANLTATALKPGVKRKHIRQMKNPVLKELASKIYSKKYQPGILLADYEAYLDPGILGEQLRIGDGFSKYEGITGVVLDKGLNYIFVGETYGNEISLVVPEWTRRAPEGIKPEQDQTGGDCIVKHKLKEGLNLVNLEKGGHAYISTSQKMTLKNIPQSPYIFQQEKSMVISISREAIQTPNSTDCLTMPSVRLWISEAYPGSLPG